MGKIIRLSNVTLTDTSAPKILVRDQIESAGSLLLFDGAHQFGSFSGVPNTGELIPNALGNIASQLVESNLVDLRVNLRSTNSAMWIAERTSRGGIHGIITQSGGQSSQLNWHVFAGSGIRDYIFNLRSTNQFYFSLWSKVTRRGLSSPAPQAPFFLASNTSNFLFHYQNGEAAAPASSPQSIGRFNDPTTGDHSSSTPIPSNRFGSLGVDGITGTGQTSTNDLTLGVGTFGPWNGPNYNVAPSRIIYRAYVEDLTVSGRTFAQVQALDYALYQAAFAPGGKFHGDTYTDPATLT